MNLMSKFVAALAILLFISGVLVAGQRNEARRQRDDALRQVATVTGDNATLRANQAGLQAGIDAQNRAIASLQKEAQTRQQQGAQALEAAQARTRTLTEQNRVLHTIIQTTHPETCDATFDAARAAL